MGQMADTGKPPISDYDAEQIEVKQYKIQQQFLMNIPLSWGMDLLSGGSRMMLDISGSKPPKEPIRIGRLLESYALDLFSAEVSYYPAEHENLQAWLESLSLRIEDMIASQVQRISGLAGISYHITDLQMRSAIRAGVRSWKPKRADAGAQVSLTAPNDRLLPAPSIDEVPPVAGSKRKDPNRAAWMAVQLKERGWDKNSLYPCGGPDRKTVQKILDGKYVRAEVFRRVVDALNHQKKNGVPLGLLDIPSD